MGAAASVVQAEGSPGGQVSQLEARAGADFRETYSVLSSSLVCCEEAVESALSSALDP